MSYDPSLHPTIQFGTVGNPVARLQKLLNDVGYPLSIDGDFGPGTKRSVIAFQSSHGLVVDGEVGPNTWTALLRAASAGPAEPVPVQRSQLEQRIFDTLADNSVSTEKSEAWCAPLAEVCFSNSINTVNRLSAFIATTLTETGAFSGSLSENLNYSASALMKIWPTRFDGTKANMYGRGLGKPADQRMIAIIAYGGRMGNSPAPSTDGWDFRGRGPIQLTGRDAYAAFQSSSNFKVLEDPELLLVPSVGAASAGWFWTRNKCNVPADSWNLRAVRKIVNGGSIGLDHFVELAEKCKRNFA
jgi:putative chitinase